MQKLVEEKKARVESLKVELEKMRIEIENAMQAESMRDEKLESNKKT
jgi:hypothetical protein